MSFVIRSITRFSATAVLGALGVFALLVLIGQLTQPGPVGQRQHRDQPRGRHKIRVVERHRCPSQSVRESHPRGALPG